MKDKVILGTVVMLVSLNSALPGLASQADLVRRDVEVAVINQRDVDAAILRSRGDEYTREFLMQFHTTTQKYCRAFQQGLADEENGNRHQFEGQVEQVAYERGREQARLAKDNRHEEQENKNDLGGQQEKIDQKTYAKRQLLPNQAQFINQIAKPAQEIGKNYDLYPSVIIAQAALESNWGTSELSMAPHYNLFGVKGQYAGKSVVKPTTEFVGIEAKSVRDAFRSYSSVKQSLEDYAKTLQQPLYEGVHRSKTSGYREATRALVGRYATDPRYDQKLNQLIDAYHLSRYDEIKKNANEQASPLAMPTQQDARIVLPKTNDQSVEARRNNKSEPPYLPLAVGMGTTGLIYGARSYWQRRNQIAS